MYSLAVCVLHNSHSFNPFHFLLQLCNQLQSPIFATPTPTPAVPRSSRSHTNLQTHSTHAIQTMLAAESSAGRSVHRCTRKNSSRRSSGELTVTTVSTATCTLNSGAISRGGIVQNMHKLSPTPTDSAQCCTVRDNTNDNTTFPLCVLVMLHNSTCRNKRSRIITSHHTNYSLNFDDDSLPMDCLVI